MPVAPAFDFAVAFTLRQETGGTEADGYRSGALHTDPADPGGTTKYGIAQRYHPDVDVAALTLELAKNLYLRRYWFAGKCDLLPSPVGIAHFDACVIPGVGFAAKALQGAAGVAQDGDIGGKTLAAVIRVDPLELACRIMTRRELRFAGDDQFAQFGSGWLRRCTDLAVLVGSLPEL
jgi:lysozyme family protein